MQVHIHDECTSRGTFREEGLAATPLLLRVQLQGQDGRGAAEAAGAAARGEERGAAAIAGGEGAQRKAGTAAPASTAKKMKKKKKKLRRRARREKQVKREAGPTTPPACKAGLGVTVESPALPSPDVEVLIKKITELCADLGWWIEFS